MRIGIIGGGGAGLTAAWLLAGEHDVTLFERSERLGGHAHTVMAPGDEAPVAVEAGFGFFSEKMFPTFMRLLRALGMALRRYPVTATVYSTDQRQATLLPPYRDGRIIWSACRPTSLAYLIQLQRTLGFAEGLMRSRDTTITLAQFFATLPVTQAFKDEFLLPFLLAQWCVEPEEFRDFAAYNIFKYAVENRPDWLRSPQFINIQGGTQAYIQRLAEACGGAQIQRGARIMGLAREDGVYVVATADGARRAFDHLIVATGPRDARALLGGLRGADAWVEALDGIAVFPTTIAVHSDRRWMPARREHWSVCNIRYDGRHAQNTTWDGVNSKQPIFRSWVTYDTELPANPYAVVRFDHPKVNLRYYATQKRLLGLQGRDNLWLAGLYMHDVDCHESAIRSAVNIARRLAPASQRLRLLDPEASDA